MTEITTSEIKILGIQIMLMAILGAFMLLYSSEPILSSSVPDNAVNQSTEVSATSQSWISNIISIPPGMGELVFISALVIAPFLFFDAIIALRFAKDIATKWI